MSKLAHSTGWTVYRSAAGLNVLPDHCAPPQDAEAVECGLLWTDAMDVADETWEARHAEQG